MRCERKRSWLVVLGRSEQHVFALKACVVSLMLEKLHAIHCSLLLKSDQDPLYLGHQLFFDVPMRILNKSLTITDSYFCCS